MRHAHTKTFRKQAWGIVTFLLFLFASGTYVFAEEFSGVGLILQSYEVVWVHPKTLQLLSKPLAYQYFVGILSDIPDSPAKRAGMPELAKLIAVDGYDVENMDPDTVAERFRGPVGSAVVLRVLVEEERNGTFGRYLKEYTLIRERIVMPDQGSPSK